MRGFGYWNLSRLGAPELVLRPGANKTIAFTLPQQAHEGPGSWYIADLHLRVNLKPWSGRQRFVFAASLNDGVFAAIQFSATQDGALHWEAMGVLDGRQQGIVARRAKSVAIHFRNYVQVSSVRGGLNHVIFGVGAVDAHAAIPVRSAVVSPSSGLWHTKTAPADVRLTLKVPRRVRRGHVFTASVHVVNVGQAPSRNVKMRIIPPTPAITAVGRSIRSAGELTHGQYRTVTFRLRARSTGTFTVVAVAGSTSNAPGESKQIRVTP